MNEYCECKGNTLININTFPWSCGKCGKRTNMIVKKIYCIKYDNIHKINFDCEQNNKNNMKTKQQDVWTITVRNNWKERLFFAIALLFDWPKTPR